MSEAQKKASTEYEKKRTIKPVSFNQETELELLSFANSVDFSNWVKKKISEEIRATK